MPKITGVASMGHWGMCPSSTSNNFILVQFGVNLKANYQNIL